MKLQSCVFAAAFACLLLAPMSHALTPIADGFNNNALDPARWQVSQFGKAKFKVSQQRVNFFIFPAFDPNEDYGYLELLNNQPGFNESWQVALTVNNTSGQGDRIGAGFWIYNADDPSDVIFFEFYGNPAKRDRLCASASFVLDGDYLEASLEHKAALLTKAKLRVIFNAKTKLFTFKVARTGKNADWTTLGTFSPTGKGGDVRANWNLNPGSGRFGIRLEGYGERRLLEGGKVYLDSFNLSRP